MTARDHVEDNDGENCERGYFHLIVPVQRHKRRSLGFFAITSRHRGQSAGVPIDRPFTRLPLPSDATIGRLRRGYLRRNPDPQFTKAGFAHGTTLNVNLPSVLCVSTDVTCQITV